MKNRGRDARNGWRRLFLATIGTAALAVPIVAGALTPPRPRAQAPVASPPIPQWQKDAGGKMAFDVASVKSNKSGSRPTSNVPLDSQGLFTPTGGLFSAMDFPLLEYTMVAYKLTREQSQAKPGYYSQ